MRFRQEHAAGGLLVAVGLVLAPGGCPSADELVASEADALVNGAAFEQMLDSVSRGLEGETLNQTLAATDLIPDTAAADSTALDGATLEAIRFEEIDLTIEELFPEAVGAGTEDPNDDTPFDVFGGLAGRWTDDGAGGGVLSGRWFSDSGDAIGVLRGAWRELPDRPDGTDRGGVFAAGIIDNSGRPRGMLRGRYGTDDSGDGVFAARWIDRRQRLVGLARGAWVAADDRSGGAFRGRWAGFNPCHRDARLDAAGDAEPGQEAPDKDLAARVLIDSAESIDPASFDDVIAAVGSPAFPADTLADALDAAAFEDPLDTPLGLEGRRPGPCGRPAARGVLRGHWVPERDPNTPFHGYWAARWRNAADTRHGTIRGIWTHRRAAAPDPNGGGLIGDRVENGEPLDRDTDAAAPEPVRRPPLRGAFRGAIFNADEELIGYIGGVFGRNRHGAGVYRAHAFGDAGEFVGRTRGRWGNDPRVPGGPIAGHWIAVPGPGPGDDPNGG